ncbi:MAG: polyisoprenyl-teichoic acid--peptidoglycan teichoic acid transferase, partial [Gaiellaceae bacterium]|nr:polyisoprenyl-teichoic acid--peptidoglycan teichoic acid transferase [Gaiellaceae bacterium]
GLFGRILLVTFLAVTSLALAVVGGAYLYAHETVHDLQARSSDVVAAQKELHVAKANAPAIALVIGYDHRAGIESGNPSLSDTLMLIRADPITKTISLLSYPRDLDVPIYCSASGPAVGTDRINSAYSRCKSKGTLFTVEKLTGLPVNYLITVNFHGFKQVVDKLGGVWMDVDRRYYNKNTGSYLNNYANINLQPGYQKLTGQQALDFVRFRHTDSDLTRTARQQSFVRAFREQVKANFSATSVPSLVHAIAGNIEIAEGGHPVSLGQVASYALFAYGLPTGHLFQDRIENVLCSLGCTASNTDIANAVQTFSNPDVQSSKAANAAALGTKLKEKAPPPSSVTVTVLNGSGVAGIAANTSYLLGQRGYKVLVPPNNLDPNTTPQNYFHTVIYYDPAQRRSKQAATAMQNLMQPADVVKLPRKPSLLALDPGSMLLVALGTAFNGTISTAPAHVIPKHVPAMVRFDASQATPLLQPLAKKVKFKLMVPTILERSSYPDTLPGDKPVRYYFIEGHHKAVRLVFRTGSTQFWGIQETDWNDAPALTDKSFRHNIGGREADLYYNGSKLHMVVIHVGSASYWVVNSLLDDLSNETMLAIAKGLKPLTSGK